MVTRLEAEQLKAAVEERLRLFGVFTNEIGLRSAYRSFDGALRREYPIGDGRLSAHEQLEAKRRWDALGPEGAMSEPIEAAYRILSSALTRMRPR